MSDRIGIRTNYIGNRKLKDEPYAVIVSNIRVVVPTWNRDLRLAPVYSDVLALKAGSITFDEFAQRYIDKKLSKLDPLQIAEEYNGYYLLCCEADHTKCHRSILAMWLRNAGVVCEEGLFQ